LRFERPRDEAVATLYTEGRPVQYAHIAAPLRLWDVQNTYAAEPWAAEMPSAGRPLDFATLDALRKHGVAVVRLTHGAGLSSTGDNALDAALPWVERYRIPPETAEVVADAKREGRRVIAVGTSVVRALESPQTSPSTTSLRIDARHRLRVASGLLTGMHDGTTSHADLVAAFLPADLLSRANRFASERGFLGHELGDSCLILGA
jgi:S-adenosylmethionine:tRNA ribosyltransferase-isomerase